MGIFILSLPVYLSFSQTDKYCTGNTSSVSLLRKDAKECYAPLQAAVPKTLCSLLNNTWNCELASVRKHCNISDRTNEMWLAMIIIEYKLCVSN
ncbi:hypothetical protein PoB_002118100 [Plakobranchus ocellatus]|uniref:Secreted protein n=1 Tax=Plakobranchus ocellatus TaxID=259542 RepID=A0AAV3ZJ79_9GAST|nr:hypothetical protein PoB_002118100 [Plakobranchus ocellatus]